MALGIFAGCKANAPLAAALLGGLLAFRAVRRRQGPALAAAVALALALGAEAYLTNLAQFGNPLWPARIQLGPWVLPGVEPVSVLLRAGQDASRLAMPLWLRTASSWLATRAPPIFDMRHGGFGPLAPLLFFGAALALRKRTLRIALVPLAAAALSPDPSIARYVLGVPALALALCAAGASAWRPAWRSRFALAAAALGATGVLGTAPGLAQDLPTARQLWRESFAERERTFGADGQAASWAALRARVGRGVIAYDASFELPYSLWRHDLQNTVLRVPDDLDGKGVAAWLRQNRVAAVVAGNGLAAGTLARAEPVAFEKLFACRVDDCSVFAVREAAP